MINPYYFIDKNLKIGIKISIGCHNVIHTNSILTITPTYSNLGFETRYTNKILKEMMAPICARLIPQCKSKNHVLLSTTFYKINEEDQRSDETDLFINLNINHNLTESDINDIDVKSQLEHQIQIQE